MPSECYCDCWFARQVSIKSERESERYMGELLLTFDR